MKHEQQLLERIRNGEQEAFSSLVKSLLPSAYKTAFLILKSKEYAEDALQNALEGAYISIMKNKEITNFKAWFYCLVYSRSIDIYRKNNRHVHNDIDDSAEAQLKMSYQSAQDKAIERENKNEIMKHLTKLNSEQSIPLFLYYYEDMGVKEIALVLGENQNTVKTRMKRGKQKLANILKNSKTYLQEVKTNGI
jgi:RNA polymerase sigma-70 factor, ECF subfamily